MYSELKKKAFSANMELSKSGLVKFTWGNVSQIDREKAVFAIKPSGVPYEDLCVDDIVVIDLNGNVLEGSLKPSSDWKTHMVLYNAFQTIGGVVHSHSVYATAFAQAGRPIKPLGTTHGDYFYGEIPITRELSAEEINSDYELETGNVIVECFKYKPLEMPSVLVKNHGPFCWGNNAKDAVHNAVVLEELAKMAVITLALNPDVPTISQTILDKHFLRKHGEKSYYGQDKKLE